MLGDRFTGGESLEGFRARGAREVRGAGVFVDVFAAEGDLMFDLSLYQDPNPAESGSQYDDRMGLTEIAL